MEPFHVPPPGKLNCNVLGRIRFKENNKNHFPKDLKEAFKIGGKLSKEN
ncbi:hypothetical protein [uncultured Methanobrevibacter sp.]|nr:hypothetical protein [uncultured Methanobrevibacter sp.]